ncbi:hypothetical protein FE240_13300 [Aeromonas simiae]|uniref:Uncharacterized protein n=1 Tax=Aeromonas simiae TaxID=218936 RepID=A0A5J6WWJ7_9GAMM|nr:hypothetical protein FE240_13300 [Aeromonas simiae]
MNVPLYVPDYPCVNKRARTVTVAYRPPPRDESPTGLSTRPA